MQRGMRVWLKTACAVVLAASVAHAADVATRPASPVASGMPAKAVDAATEEAFNKLKTAFMNSNFEDFDEQIKKVSIMQFKLTAEQRKDLFYIKSAYAEVRPKWWPSTKSTSNISFPIALWGKLGMANFEPGDELGESQPIKVVNNQLIAVVRWRPQFVDSTKPVKGLLGERFHVTEGNFAETIIWHELGHTYVTAWIPLAEQYELYTKYPELFFHLQEFYADMTAVRHASPKSRLLTLMFRLDEIDPPFDITYRTKEAHTRAAHAIGSLFLNEFLSNPQKWPNVHFPAEIPSDDVERKVITYVYEHFDPAWSLDDDQRMRDFAISTLSAYGLRILQSKGIVPLRDGQFFALMYADDLKLRPRRDIWVAEKMKKIIASGRADKKEESERKLRPKDLEGITKIGQYRNPSRFMLPIE